MLKYILLAVFVFVVSVMTMWVIRNQLAKKLADAPGNFLNKAATAYNLLVTQVRYNGHANLADMIEAAYHAAKGCPEFKYRAFSNSLYGFSAPSIYDKVQDRGLLRVPDRGAWMYVCAWDKNG